MKRHAYLTRQVKKKYNNANMITIIDEINVFTPKHKLNGGITDLRNKNK